MSATEDIETTSNEQVPLTVPRRTRIDPAHPLEQQINSVDSPAAPSREAEPAGSQGRAGDKMPLLEVDEPTAEMIAAVVGENVELRREQLELQVGQLAGHLQERLREVDRREATVNARSGQLESDLRTSRMWLREKELAFQEREAELKRRIEELEERCELRGHDIQSAAIDADTRASELNEREQQLQLREDDLRERRFEVDRQAAALRHAQQVWEQQHQRQQRQLADERDQMQRRFESLAAEREQQLRSAELLVNEHAAQIERDRAALVADRGAWEQQRSRQSEAIDELRTAAESELTDRRARLEARQEWIERQKGGLEQVRDEALRLHRQSLEMRLLAEQLWSQITGSLTPAETAQSLAQLRLKLSEQYDVEERQLIARRDELVSLSEKIAAQHREIVQLKEGVRQWAAARQGEIEQQAAALVQRELTLDAQQEQFRAAEHAWSAERRTYERQIRDLMSQLRTLPAAA